MGGWAGGRTGGRAGKTAEVVMDERDAPAAGVDTVGDVTVLLEQEVERFRLAGCPAGEPVDPFGNRGELRPGGWPSWEDRDRAGGRAVVWVRHRSAGLFALGIAVASPAQKQGGREGGGGGGGRPYIPDRTAPGGLKPLAGPERADASWDQWCCSFW